MAVRQLDSGLWQAEWNDRHPNGTRWRRFASYKHKRDAELREMEGIIEAKRRVQNDRPELRRIDEMVEYFRSLSRYTRLEEVTKIRYEQLIKHFTKWCDSNDLVFLQQWDRDVARRYESFVYSKFSGKGVNHNIALIKALFAEELLRARPAIHENPLILVRPKKIPRKEIRIFEAEEIELILKESYEPHRHIWNTLLYTGMRSGEWRNFPPHHVITVNGNTALRIDEWRGWKPKSFKSRRIIPNIAEPVQEAVEYFGTINAGQPYLFSGPHPRYKQYLVEMFNSVRNRVRRKHHVSLEGTHVHCFRYTFGSTLLQLGTPIEVVSDLLGHEEVSTTTNIYARLAPHNLHAGMERLKAITTASPSVRAS